MCERSSSGSSVEDVHRYSLVLNGDGEQPEEVGVTGLTCPDQSGVTGCRELLDDITSWLQSTVPTLERMQQTERAGGVEDLRAEAKDLRVRFRSNCSRSAARSVQVWWCVYI